MVNKVNTTLKKSPNSKTQYLVIPAAMTQDSQYPFGEAEEVEVYIDSERKELRIRSATRLKSATELQNERILSARHRHK